MNQRIIYWSPYVIRLVVVNLVVEIRSLKHCPLDREFNLIGLKHSYNKGLASFL